MTDDLVKQLRSTTGDACRCGTPVCLEAADLIEKLEATLREILDISPFVPGAGGSASFTDLMNLVIKASSIAHQALEGKDD